MATRRVYGYNEFIADIDAIVMDRKTFEKVFTFDKWHYGNKRVVALTNHLIDLSVVQARGGRRDWSEAMRDLVSTSGLAELVEALGWLGNGDKNLLSMHSVIWDRNLWVGGGYAVFAPAYDPTLRSWLARPYGRILFAGEHTSLRW